jgi:hypothetical protein
MRDLLEATVQLTVPNDPKYLRLVRLVVASTATDANFSYDAIEDLRIVADELVNHVMTASDPNATIEIGIFPAADRFAFQSSGSLQAQHDQPPISLDVLAAQIVNSLVDSYDISVREGRIQASFAARIPVGSIDA